MERNWIGVDLDGTLAVYTHWQGLTHIGEPVPAMVERVKTLLQAGQRVKIFTARCNSRMTQEDRETVTKAIQDWCAEHIGQVLEVTSEKDFYMVECYDDRCISVEFNTGKIIRTA